MDVIKTKKGTVIPEAILVILSLILVLGINFVFHACAAGEDGTYMSCHWAQQAVFAVSIIMLCISVIALMMKNNGYVQSGLLTALIPCSIIEMAIPGGFISLCMMAEMRCRMIMRPSVILISCIILVVSVIAIILNHRKKRSA